LADLADEEEWVEAMAQAEVEARCKRNITSYYSYNKDSMMRFIPFMESLLFYHECVAVILLFDHHKV